MLSLFRVVVESVGAADVVLTLTPLVETAETSASKNFALQLLVESHWVLANGFIFTPQPSPQEDLIGLAEASSSVDQYGAWFEMMHGKRVEITEGEYEKLAVGVDEEGISSWGMEKGIFYKEYAPRPTPFISDAERLIAHVDCEVLGDSTRMEFGVVDPALIEHLTVGVNWESAVREMQTSDDDS